MPFLGTIRDDLDGMVEIASGALDTISMEITFLNRRGTGIERMLAVSIPSGATIQYPLPIRRINPSRMIIDLKPPVGGQGTVRIVQGATTFAVVFVEDVGFVLDVVAAT